MYKGNVVGIKWYSLEWALLTLSWMCTSHINKNPYAKRSMGEIMFDEFY